MMHHTMRKTLSFLLTATVLCACGGSNSNSPTDATNAPSAISSECKEFLDGYEKYVDDYIQLLKDYKSNPTDLSLMQRATTMAEDAKTWGDKAAPDCKDASEFMSRQMTIQAKLTKASFSL